MGKIRNEYIRGTAHVGHFGDKVWSWSIDDLDRPMMAKRRVFIRHLLVYNLITRVLLSFLQF